MTVQRIEENVSLGFYRSVKRFPGRPALNIDGEVYSYEQLSQMAEFFRKVINDIKKEEHLVSLLAYRSVTAYAGLLGILCSGCGYMPLHPDFPAERIFRAVDLAKVNLMIVGRECKPAFDGVLKLIDRRMTFILVDIEESAVYSENFPQHHFIIVHELHRKSVGLAAIEPVHPENVAYLLFTSGSTGEPKGVPVSHYNVRSYLEFLTATYDINENDRISQMHDMTFDVSIHDIFVAWETGACSCVATRHDKLLARSFIQKNKLTVWTSAPSLAGIIDSYRILESGEFPSLRYSFFIGEALSVGIVEKWQQAAVNSKIINIYGPTETTIAITYYEWDEGRSPGQCVNGIVPIGKVFDGHRVRILRENGEEAGVGESGELCLSGPQVTKGYWNNAKQTALQYLIFPDTGDTLCYKTGDLAHIGEDGCLYFLGRIDNQVKIFGYRIELGEIDKILKEATGIELSVSVPLLISPGNARGIVAVVCSAQELDENIILEYCRSQLPPYMVPTRVHRVDEMPVNVNGKIDRLRLAKIFETIS